MADVLMDSTVTTRGQATSYAGGSVCTDVDMTSDSTSEIASSSSMQGSLSDYEVSIHGGTGWRRPAGLASIS